MRLIDVYTVQDAATYLYALLLEREESQNISHRAMPTVEQHLKFIRSNPYREWYLIEEGGRIVGATYLTKQAEIGIFIFKEFRGNGCGKQAIRMMLEKHQGERVVANINPQNQTSVALFSGLGAKLIQFTYEVPT